MKDMKKRWEIGSEFEHAALGGRPSKLTLPRDFCPTWTLSGRTAIDLAIHDAGHIRKVCIPSYCCTSMIEPFLDNGIEVSYYQVSFDGGLCIDLRIPMDCDALLIMSYFGYSCQIAMDELYAFKKRGGVVIEDITHMLFAPDACGKISDYLVASVRKWGPVISGGFVAVRNREIRTELVAPDAVFLRDRQKAMRLKEEYLLGADVDKHSFLQLYREANEWLAKHYRNCAIDNESSGILSKWNCDQIVTRRRTNAAYLHMLLEGSDIVTPVFKAEQIQCPLFVPVTVREGKRKNLQNRLRENGIYCPIHWPKPETGCESNLYDLELSLICDQRYVEQDMLRIVSVINSRK